MPRPKKAEIMIKGIVFKGFFTTNLDVKYMKDKEINIIVFLISKSKVL